MWPFTIHERATGTVPYQRYSFNISDAISLSTVDHSLTSYKCSNPFQMVLLMLFGEVEQYAQHCAFVLVPFLISLQVILMCGKREQDTWRVNILSCNMTMPLLKPTTFEYEETLHFFNRLTMHTCSVLLLCILH